MKNVLVDIWTDGSCLGNPGPGGWAAMLVRHGATGTQQREISGSAPATTNNRMEMMAVLRALRFLKTPRRVRLQTDSELIVKTMTEWLPARLRSGWKANGDLWQSIYEETLRHQVEWVHVRGHAGEPNNERCDGLAKAAAAKAAASVSASGSAAVAQKSLTKSVKG